MSDHASTETHTGSAVATPDRAVRVERRRGSSDDPSLRRDLADLGFSTTAVRRTELVFLGGCFDDDGLQRVLDVLVAEPLDTVLTVDTSPETGAEVTVVEVARRAGVTDPAAAELVRAANRLGVAVDRAASGTRLELVDLLDADGRRPSTEVLAELSGRLFANPVVEQWAAGTVEPGFVHATHRADATRPGPGAAVVAVRSLDSDGLAALNRERGLALDPEELDAIRTWCGGEARDLTDVELETLAQTWSEHCSHKTFRAQVIADDGRPVEPLLRQLQHATEAIAAPWVVSAFVGNAGIVELHPGERIAVKVETHNHPSAVEPFGGANTGVGGVIRDVLAAPAQPIALTDILCFGPADTDPRTLPAGVLSPRRIEAGVVSGVADYGNKMGVPTIAGAVLYDPGYTANPLVFCGCIGRVHRGADALDGPHPGDRVLVIGGPTGRDGIRGATFSSMTMDATTGSVAGASVQIGDPIVEKLVTDALAELADRPDPLFTALTDCGAGGLASAVGEMADGVGARIDLRLAPRKYPGLAAWEVWLSEAQERMVLAVHPSRTDEVISVCRRHGVTVADLGAFSGDGRLVVRDGTEVVLDLPTSFLHHGRPTRRMIASMPVPDRSPRVERTLPGDVGQLLLSLLAHPNIASKAAIIHRYDHEVLGATIVRPLTGAEADGPSDGTVLARPVDTHGLAVGIGVNPWFGVHDPLRMAHSVVDEAIRNVVAAGADPDRIALLDNFSWGDPRRPSTLGALAAAVQGCCEAAVAHGAPFVSGKDSLNNEYLGADGQRHAIPPTLVITAVAGVPDADRTVTSDCKRAGNLIFLTGRTSNELRGSHFDMVMGIDGGGDVPAADDDAPRRYRAIHAAMRAGLVAAAHDCAEGGLAVALAEMAIGGRLGIDAELTGDPLVALFSESNGRLLLEVAPGDAEAVRSMIAHPVTPVGTVTDGSSVHISVGDVTVACTIDELRHAWQGNGA